MPIPAHTTVDPLATASRPSPIDDVLERLSAGWGDGRNPRVEEFLSEIDPGDPEALVELVYHEYCLAEAAGMSISGVRTAYSQADIDLAARAVTADSQRHIHRAVMALLAREERQAASGHVTAA